MWKKNLKKKKKFREKIFKIPGNEKKFRFLGTFRKIPSFSKFRRNFLPKKVEKFRQKFRNSGPEFRLLGIAAFSLNSEDLYVKKTQKYHKSRKFKTKELFLWMYVIDLSILYKKPSGSLLIK